jgi:hypothetical protein
MKTTFTKLIPLLLTTACYGSAPPRPPQIPLPAPQEGAQIDVHSVTKTAYETVQKRAVSCPSGKSEGHPDCTVTTYDVQEPVTRTRTTATYGGEPIDYAQFMVMTDPKYGDKVAAAGRLSHACQRANVPRYVGLASFAAGLIVGPIVAKSSEDAGRAIAYGGLIGGAGVFAAGYFAFGGRDCNEARAIYNSIDYRRSMGVTTVQGSHVASEMAALAQQFNASQGRNRTSLEMRKP